MNPIARQRPSHERLSHRRKHVNWWPKRRRRHPRTMWRPHHHPSLNRFRRLWQLSRLSRHSCRLAQRFSQEAAKQPQPEVHIRADRHVHYEKVAQVMALAAKAGLVRIGFVSEPQ
ncbi:MAG: biopolymer transporter ExbD [Rhodoferax sp.]|nr:biopolymer transporter ExbD [Rhodoferax sp.]